MVCKCQLGLSKVDILFFTFHGPNDELINQENNMQILAKNTEAGLEACGGPTPKHFKLVFLKFVSHPSVAQSQP